LIYILVHAIAVILDLLFKLHIIGWFIYLVFTIIEHILFVLLKSKQ
jgi:hypothetical protein